jgi:hypothetical protein
MPVTAIRQDACLVAFITTNVLRGISIGISFAILVLVTDAFGISTLISAQRSPMTVALIFTLVSSFKFVALTIAVAVGLLGSVR